LPLADGRFVVAGILSGVGITLTRYNANGGLDTSFGAGGMVRVDNYQAAWGVGAVLPADGQIVVAGHYVGFDDLLLARVHLDGSLDASFGDGGQVVLDLPGGSFQVFAAVQQADGKTVVAGTGSSADPPELDVTLVRIHADGSLDTTFGVGGVVFADIGRGL